jgi:hypothetical protein
MSEKARRLTQRLRELDPVPPNAVDDEPAPDDLLQTILASDLSSAQPQRGRSTLPRRRWALAPVAAAVVLGLALVVGLPGGGSSHGGTISALDNVAAAAAAAPPAEELPYLFLKTRALTVNTASAGGEIWSTYDAELREEWASPDGSGHVRIEAQAPTFVGPGDRAAWEAAGSPSFLTNGFNSSTSEKDLPAGAFADASDLPADPELLAQRLRGEAESSHKSAPVGARMLELIAEDLRNPRVNPEQRAALYRAAQEVPGIEYLGQATDPAGRQGVAVGISSSYSGEPTSYRLIYGPQTTEVLAYEVEAQHPVGYADNEGPLVTSATVYLDAGSSASVPQSNAVR